MRRLAILLVALLLATTAAAGERALIDGLAGNANFQALVDASRPYIGLFGATGENIPIYRYVAPQRAAHAAERAGRTADADRAYGYAFRRQAAGGWFRNNLGYAPLDAIEADSFFMASLGRTMLMRPALPVDRGAVTRAMAWLMANPDALRAHAAPATNRLLYAATAHLFVGEWLDDAEVYQRGVEFAAEALDRQDAAGWFLENGGWDSGYQAVSVHLLAVIVEQFGDHRDELALAAAWLASRVDAAGNVSSDGNTRTGPGSPEGKPIPRQEVAWALYYAGAVLDDPALIAEADAVVAGGL